MNSSKTPRKKTPDDPQIATVSPTIGSTERDGTLIGLPWSAPATNWDTEKAQRKLGAFYERGGNTYPHLPHPSDADQAR